MEGAEEAGLQVPKPPVGVQKGEAAQVHGHGVHAVVPALQVPGDGGPAHLGKGPGVGVDLLAAFRQVHHEPEGEADPGGAEGVVEAVASAEAVHQELGHPGHLHPGPHGEVQVRARPAQKGVPHRPPHQVDPLGESLPQGLHHPKNPAGKGF